MDVPEGDVTPRHGSVDWVTNEVRTASDNCSVTITVHAPIEPNRCAVRAAIGDAVQGVEALLGFSG